MKKAFAVLLALTLILSLCACGSAPAPAPAPADSAQPAAPVVTPAAADDKSSVDSQLKLIFDNLNTLKSDDATTSFWYTVTDLDHNGRLELVAAVTEGTGSVTRGAIYEVNQDYASFTSVDLGLSSDASLPEIITNVAPTYYNSGNYYYVFTDTMGVGLGQHYSSKVSLNLNNARLTLKALAHQDVENMNGYTVYTFYDQNGNRVEDPTTFNYDNIGDTVYANLTKTTTNFDWFSLADAATVQRLANSYQVFAGNAIPVNNGGGSAPAPVVTAAPTAAPVNPIVVVTNPTITKNPTGENPVTGGNCTFIAKAIGYNYMYWQLISTSGGVYNLTQSNPFPVMGVSGSNGQTLVLSNVPYELNGWSVRAAFVGDTDTIYTTQAYIYVNDKATISVSPASGEYFTQTNNYVCVYSSNGQNIHVECTQSGNTGAYYSDNVSSGSYIPINGISGQAVGVTVYLSCGNAQTTVYYTVDCTPIIPIVPVTPAPVISGTAYGTLGVQQTMSTIPINVGGGVYYVSLDLISPQGADLSPGAGCTVYYNGDLNNITSVVLDGGTGGGIVVGGMF